jgi:uncharacterized membrane protein
MFSSAVRYGLIVGAVLLVILAIYLLRKRKNRTSTVVGVLAIGCVGAVAAEAMIAVAVKFAAPKGASFNEYRWVVLSPWGRVGLVLGALCVFAIVILAWRSTRGAVGWQRSLMIGLRTAAALTAFVMFLEPAVELRQVAREPNRIAILVDDSKSMALREKPQGPTRIQRAQKMLSASQDVLDEWEREHKIDVFTFGENISASTIAGLANNEARSPTTQLRKSLEAIRARYDGRELAGIVVISDGAAAGQFDDQSNAGAARDFLRSLETKVHTVMAARPGLKDLAVKRVLADEFAFVRTVVKIDAVIYATPGSIETGESNRIPITLSTDGEPLREKMVEIPRTGGEVHVTFEVTPERVGRYVYQITAPSLPGEPVTSNNQSTFVIRVIRDKIRVLQVSGQPSWDEKALRQMLKSNPNVDLISFFILRTQDDISLVPNDEMSLIPFPTRELFEEQLPSFDVIVLQNFEYLPYGIGEYLENLRSYTFGGGGLVMLGGNNSFTSGGYHGTPLAAALPLTLQDPYDGKDHVDTSRFSPALTDAGMVHPVTALRFSPTDNAAAWRNLPQLEGVNLVPAAAADATVLATHPRLKGDSKKPMPVIAVMDYGKGRSLAVTTDTLWRWGFVAAQKPGDDGRQYTKFWENAIRWLIQDPDLRNLHVDTDAVEYPVGANVRVDIRLLGRDYQPLPAGQVKLVLRRGAKPSTSELVKEVTLTVSSDGTSSQQWNDLTDGIYRVTGTATVDGRTVESTDIFLVRDAGHEFDNPTGDPETLRVIATATGGQALGEIDRLPNRLAFDSPRVVRVDRRADVELWSRPGLLVLMVLLLGLEWWFRQRRGYV